VDPKGDVANLALVFPDQSPDDFKKWVSPAHDPGADQRVEVDRESCAAASTGAAAAGCSSFGTSAKCCPAQVPPHVPSFEPSPLPSSAAPPLPTSMPPPVPPSMPTRSDLLPFAPQADTPIEYLYESTAEVP
jgi:hypothetical protein